MTFASNDSVKTMKCIRPRVLIVGIAFTGTQFPVRRMTGVMPLARQVRVVAWSDRIPTWSPKRIFSVVRLRTGPNRQPALLVPEADSFRMLLDRPPVRTLEGQRPSA